MFSYNEWQLVNDVFDKFDPTTKIILLGGNYIQYENWVEHFQLFKRSNYAHGFTIGRSTFWEPWQQFISGEISLDDVPAQVAQNLQTFIDYWNNSATIAENVL